MKAAATSALRKTTSGLGSWDILSKGNVKGKAAVDQKGALLRTVGNYGVAKGDRLVLMREGCTGFAVRCLEGCKPVLNHNVVAKAMDGVSKGEDMQQLSSLLQHSDVSTVKALIKAWHVAWKVTPPIEYTDEDEGLLDTEAQDRLLQKATDTLQIPFLVDDCGCDTLTGKPLVPSEWIGRRFDNGSHLQSELPSASFKLATYNLQLAPQEVWTAPAPLLRSLEAQNVTPVSVVEITNNPFKVSINPFPKKAPKGGWKEAIASYGSEKTHSYRAMLGFEPESDIHKSSVMKTGLNEELSCNAATIILAVDKTLLSTPPPAHVAVKPAPSALLSPLSSSCCNILYPASLLQKAIRRGITLSGSAPILQSINHLCGAPAHHVPELQYRKVTGTRTALWKVFISALEDVGPFASDDGKYLCLQELLGLTLVAHVDDSFRLTEQLKKKLIITALRLQGNDHSASLWPWKGWRRSSRNQMTNKNLSVEEGTAEICCIRNSLRIALLGLPVTRGEKLILLRYLGGLGDKGVWAKAVFTLPECHAEAANYTESAHNQKLNHEVHLAAADSHLRPTTLLLLQAGLPRVPTDTMQHSLRALAEALWSLSSGLNVRELKQKLNGAAQETYRFLSFVTDTPNAALDITPDKLGIYECKENETDKVAKEWKSQRDGQRLTQHEELLLNVIQQLQKHFHDMLHGRRHKAPAPIRHKPVYLPTEDEMGGRKPTPFEARTAFLQLFGSREAVSAASAEGKQVSCLVTLAGTVDEPYLVQKVSGTDSGDQTGRRGLSDKILENNAKSEAYKVLSKEKKVLLPVPPVGFIWKWEKTTVSVRIENNENDYLHYFVEGKEVDPFNASALLVSCNEPRRVMQLPQELGDILRKMFYLPNEKVDDVLASFEKLEQYAQWFRSSKTTTCDDIYDWVHLANQSTLPKSIWRDMVIKIATREGDVVEVSRCARDGTKTGPALQQLSEGVLLRILYALQALYPAVLERTSELRFTLTQHGAQFVHLQRVLNIMAFGSYDDGEAFHTALHEDNESAFSFEDEIDEVSEDITVPEVSTDLWSHQNEAVTRVLTGVAEGKRGFADASAVGAGKTLTALACCVRASEWLAKRKLRRHGFLVLVPNNDLIGEWIQQALLHTRGLHIVAQQHTGYLISRGVSNGGKPPAAHPSTRRYSTAPKVDCNTVVVSTLGRLRDKPFVSQAGWDMVVIDECLSVQNDSALQTIEAWRQVAASRCGVLMLSATLFRSRMSKLFYMIRMLRSALPRTEKYLPTLLAEHIICYLPERVRTWKLRYIPVPMSKSAMELYQSRLAAAARSQKDARLVYGELKSVVRDHWEHTAMLEAFDKECKELQEADRHVLMFANSENELGRIKKKCKQSRTWNSGKASAPRGSGPLVVTTQRGAYGLNLQEEADSIICRPQPGDLIEQMKGRVDRPGQKTKELVLNIIYAEGTIEEVEAANIRLCGAFFRQYIDPLGRLFQERAVEASITAMKHVQPRKGAAGGGKSKSGIQGSVAAAFHQQINVTEAAPEVADKTKAKVSNTNGTPKSDEGGGKRKNEDESPTKAKKAKPSPKAAKAAAAEARKRKAEQEMEDLRELAEFEASLPKTPKRMTNESSVQGLAWLTERDPILASVIAQVGPPVDMVSQLGNDPAFKSLVRTIVFQQISMKAANSIFTRFAECVGGEITLEAVNAVDDLTLRKAGLSERKVSYVRNICEKFTSGELTDEKLDMMEDKDVLKALCSIKGMGEWSSHVFMMFNLGRHDVLPVGDIAVQKAFQKLYSLSPHDATSETQVQYFPPAKEMEELAKCWRPYRTIGTWYMWHVVETKEAAYTYGS